MNVEGSGIMTQTSQPSGFAQNLLATIAGLGTQFIQAKATTYQQKILTKTYDPARTTEAMRSIEYQRAYEAQQRQLAADRASGTLTPQPYAGVMTSKTLWIVAGVGLAAYLIARKR